MPAGRRSPRIVVIGAGIGGLAAALTLAARGLDVTVVERALLPGGKLRTTDIGGEAIDCGPTVLTMRDVFETIFADAGETLGEHLHLTPADVLARHAWPDGSAPLDLFADIERSADAIGAFSGPADARGYRAFCAQARTLFDTLDAPFIRADKPDMLRLLGPAARAGRAFAAAPFTSFWRALGTYFEDARLRQLFGRYATYCGSSPFATPSTLMLVAHVEQSGVWLVQGGMHRLAEVLVGLAKARGVTFRFGDEVSAIHVEGGRTSAVDLESGERLEADAVVCNADCAALASGLFGDAVRPAATGPQPKARSLSAMTYALRAKPHGVPLSRHNVFFSADSPAEFAHLAAGRLPTDPTVYVCAQDRGGTADEALPDAPERLFCIVNAAATGDTHTFDESEIAQCEARTFRALDRCGLTLDWSPGQLSVTTPNDFHRLYPATGGALYGAASHGWMASFRRSGVRSRVPGLYLCGGSVHPGPGLPMAALSGRMAALALTADCASMRRFRPAATLGGISTA